MSKFSDLSAQLDKALSEVEKTKKAMDDASAKLTAAATAHNAAVEAASSLRTALENEINEALGKVLKPKIG